MVYSSATLIRSTIARLFNIPYLTEHSPTSSSRCYLNHPSTPRYPTASSIARRWQHAPPPSGLRNLNPCRPATQLYEWPDPLQAPYSHPLQARRARNPCRPGRRRRPPRRRAAPSPTPPANPISPNGSLRTPHPLPPLLRQALPRPLPPPPPGRQPASCCRCWRNLRGSRRRRR